MPGVRTTRSAFHHCLAGRGRGTASCALVVSALLAAGSREAQSQAQSAGDLAAWGALVVSPVGALPPRVHDALFSDSARTELSVRYGRWRYDLDDAIHNTMGVALTREIPAAHTGITITGALLSSSCGTCSAGLSAGIAMQTRLLRHAITADSLYMASVGIYAAAGGGRFGGEGRAQAMSLTGAPTFSVAFPFAWSTRLAVSILPGVGVGRYTSADEDAYGTRPMFGATMAWAIRGGFVVDFGMQRIFIDGGPSQLGTSLSWVRR